MKQYCFFIIITLFTLSCSQTTLEVFELKIENRSNPLGMQTIQPRFSWKLNSSERGLQQLAYQIFVASTDEGLNNGEIDLWDSGKIESNRSIFIPYQGIPLNSRQIAFWKVRIWTNQGEIISTEMAFWTMALLNEDDWKAQWIGLETVEAEGENRKSDFRPQTEDELRLKSETRLNARYLRKEISVKEDIKSATLYISGLGLFEAFINGEKIGDQVLSPTPTDYAKRIPYNTFDVTGLVKEGQNTLAVILGNGRFFSMRIPWFRTFGLPQLLYQLEVTDNNGSKQTYISDDSWKITIDGPIGSNNEFDGEEYDARKEMLGWDKNNFDDHAWLPVELVKAPEGKLWAQENLNIKVMELVKPSAINKISEDKYILDMGQNMVGWIKLTVEGKKGDKVTTRFAELLKEDGEIYTDNLRGAKATNIYTLKGEGVEEWEPKFVFHGFRYVEITGFPGIPTIDNFIGKVVYDEMETVGSFTTSNNIINQIYKNSYWSIRGNYRGMPTDCPQRDERMGWLGDRTTGSYGENYIFDNHNLYVKWLDDIEDSQLANGALPDVAPNYWEMYTDDVTWPAAYFTITDMIHKKHGNTRPIIKHYDSFKKFLSYIQNNYMQGYIVTKDTFGDWCMPPESPEMIHSQDPARKTEGALLATAFYYRLIILMQEYAQISGNTQDIAVYNQLGEKIKEAFNKKFYNADLKNYSNNTVTANLLAIMHGLVDESIKNDVFEHITSKTKNEFNSHVSTGLIGIQWLMRGLSDYNEGDLAYKIATNTSYPSWGYMIEQGATTIWELWNGDTADPAMSSGNHVMLLGDLIVWYYEYLAGIKYTAAEGLVMKPLMINDLKYVKASYNSPHGLIESHWNKENDTFLWDITVPGNCTATISLPDAVGKIVTETNKNIVENGDIKNIRTQDNHVVLCIGSGKYSFSVK